MAGTVTVFEGKNGFFQAQSQDVDTGAVCRGLGEEYHIGDTYSKLYPTCRHSQPAIEGVLDLMEEYGFGYREVEAVRVGTHQVAMDLTGRITLPESASEAKFSLAYGVALALSQGGWESATWGQSTDRTRWSGSWPVGCMWRRTLRCRPCIRPGAGPGYRWS